MFFSAMNERHNRMLCSVGKYKLSKYCHSDTTIQLIIILTEFIDGIWFKTHVPLLMSEHEDCVLT